MLKRYHGEGGNIEITINNLADIGKTFSDITDVYFGLKVNLADDDDSLFYKTLNTSPGPGGITLVSGESKIIVAWGADEYEGMVVGDTYYICFSVLFNGQTVHTEITINHSKVEILQDRVRR